MCKLPADVGAISAPLAMDAAVVALKLSFNAMPF
jgi:hypothetical protein